jgi:hypothetical protein
MDILDKLINSINDSEDGFLSEANIILKTDGKPISLERFRNKLFEIKGLIENPKGLQEKDIPKYFTKLIDYVEFFSNLHEISTNPAAQQQRGFIAEPLIAKIMKGHTTASGMGIASGLGAHAKPDIEIIRKTNKEDGMDVYTREFISLKYYKEDKSYSLGQIKSSMRRYCYKNKPMLLENGLYPKEFDELVRNMDLKWLANKITEISNSHLIHDNKRRAEELKKMMIEAVMESYKDIHFIFMSGEGVENIKAPFIGRYKKIHDELDKKKPKEYEETVGLDFFKFKIKFRIIGFSEIEQILKTLLNNFFSSGDIKGKIRFNGSDCSFHIMGKIIPETNSIDLDFSKINEDSKLKEVFGKWLGIKQEAINLKTEIPSLILKLPSQIRSKRFGENGVIGFETIASSFEMIIDEMIKSIKAYVDNVQFAMKTILKRYKYKFSQEQYEEIKNIVNAVSIFGGSELTKGEQQIGESELKDKFDNMLEEGVIDSLKDFFVGGAKKIAGAVSYAVSNVSSKIKSFFSSLSETKQKIDDNNEKISSSQEKLGDMESNDVFIKSITDNLVKCKNIFMAFDNLQKSLSSIKSMDENNKEEGEMDLILEKRKYGKKNVKFWMDRLMKKRQKEALKKSRPKKTYSDSEESSWQKKDRAKDHSKPLSYTPHKNPSLNAAVNNIFKE